MIEEIENQESEAKLIQKVKSKKRIRGLLIGINAILACYLIFEIIMKVSDLISSVNNDSDIISLNGKNKTDSLGIYDNYLIKDENHNYLTSDAYDFGIYGGYLHLSQEKMTTNNYHSFSNTSLINVSSRFQTSINQNINKQYLNRGIDLTSLDNGDYLVFDEYITEETFSNKHKAIKIRSYNGIEKTIYTLPQDNGYRKKITIKSKDSSPSLVISVNEVNALPKEYYDFVFIGDNESIDSYLKENSILSNIKILKTDSLLEAFKHEANFCIILSDLEKTLIPNSFFIKTEDQEFFEYNDEKELYKYSFNEYVTELGGYLTNSGACISGKESTYITKPYLKGYDIGKLVIATSNNISFNYIYNLL